MGEIRVSEFPDPYKPEDRDLLDLYTDVRNAVLSLPSYFETDIQIEGVEASDLFGLGDLIGTAIEKQIVSTLNGMRSVWDPDSEYMNYRWVRQPQTFPDAILVESGEDDQDPIMGIEVKTWYILAKEGAASFRFETSQDACALQDLIIVVPWHLEHVLAGSPVLREPWVESAKTAAEYVDYHWCQTRDTSKNQEVIYPESAEPYPDRKKDEVQKKPEEPTDNYGRLNRSAAGHDSIMDDYLDGIKKEEIQGIPISEWISFLRDATQ